MRLEFDRLAEARQRHPYAHTRDKLLRDGVKPTVRLEDLAGATNYVQRALTEARAGREVTPGASPYGCSIHYAATQSK